MSKEVKNVILGFAVLNICILIFLIYSYDLISMDFSIPLSYNGGDDYAYLLNAKMIEQTGWITDFSRLGAPYNTDYREFNTWLLFNFDNLGLKLFDLIFGNWVKAVNYYYLFLFFMIGNISYIVLRKLGINRGLSVSMSLLYSFSPYIFMRGIGHMALSAYQFIPFSILICFWIYEDNNLFERKNIFYKRNIFVLIMLLLISNNGIGYYAFFTCFLMLVSGILKLLKGDGYKTLIKSLVLCLICAILLTINLLPMIIYSKHNSAINNFERLFSDAEVYGLKIVQMLLPSTGRVGFIDEIYKKYMTYAPLLTENTSSFLGYIGAVGFVILIFVLLSKEKKGKANERLHFLANLNICAVLLGTIGGLGVMFNLLITSQIRSYNRISIYIMYICLIACAVILNEIQKSKWSYAVFCVLIFGVYLQIPLTLENSEINRVKYENDKQFVEAIEASVESGSMIYQMPYHPYPESGNVNQMCDYALFNGYLFSEKLQWSYGFSRGGESDNWQLSFVQLPISDQVNEIKIKGFAGIYIDLDAYSEEQSAVLLNEMNDIFGEPTIQSNNGKLLFYKY